MKHGCTCLVLLACHLFHLCRQRRGKTQRGTGGLLIFVEPLLPGPAWTVELSALAGRVLLF